jgi:hypothetical protein
LSYGPAGREGLLFFRPDLRRHGRIEHAALFSCRADEVRVAAAHGGNAGRKVSSLA